MNKQVKLVRTQHYFRLGHPLIESIEWLISNHWIQLKVRTYGRIIVLKTNKIYFTGVEQETKSHRRELIHLHNQTLYIKA